LLTSLPSESFRGLSWLIYLTILPIYFTKSVWVCWSLKISSYNSSLDSLSSFSSRWLLLAFCCSRFCWCSVRSLLIENLKNPAILRVLSRCFKPLARILQAQSFLSFTSYRAAAASASALAGRACLCLALAARLYYYNSDFSYDNLLISCLSY